MIPKSVLVLVLLQFFNYQSLAVQNLCGEKADVTHVADPSLCSSYLFCRRNDTNPAHIIGVYQLTCLGNNADYFEADDPTGTPPIAGKCVQVDENCAKNTNCPSDDEDDIMIANPNDAECRQYRPCRLKGFPWMSCTAPLVFNRNSGSCDFEERAPCNPDGGGSAPTCPPGGTGQFPGSKCYEYIFCFEGEPSGTYECGDGLKFDEEKSSCIPDTNGDCVRTAMSEMIDDIPRVPVFRGRYPRIQSHNKYPLKFNKY